MELTNQWNNIWHDSRGADPRRAGRGSRWLGGSRQFPWFLKPLDVWQRPDSARFVFNRYPKLFRPCHVTCLPSSPNRLARLLHLARHGQALLEEESRENFDGRIAVIVTLMNFVGLDVKTVSGLVRGCWFSFVVKSEGSLLDVDYDRTGMRVPAFPSAGRDLDHD